MTDRELLELAKKAAGVFGDYVENRAIQGANRTGIWDGLNEYCWNPLTNDGDALRLAVDVGIDISEAQCKYWDKHGNDPYAATRRAIVCAAAEIGKEMK